MNKWPPEQEARLKQLNMYSAHEAAKILTKEFGKEFSRLMVTAKRRRMALKTSIAAERPSRPRRFSWQEEED